MFKRITTLILVALSLALVATQSYGEDNIAEKAINEPRVSKLLVYARYQTNQDVVDNTMLGETAKRIAAKADGALGCGSSIDFHW